jgi:hypothetical protein
MEANYHSAQDAVSSYQFAHASEFAYAGDAIVGFFATATYELPEYDTATEESEYPFPFSTDIPLWFTELPAEVWNIKIQDLKISCRYWLQ